MDNKIVKKKANLVGKNFVAKRSLKIGIRKYARGEALIGLSERQIKALDSDDILKVSEWEKIKKSNKSK